MSVSSSEALERSVLEGKDREQLITIAGALGVKSLTRAKKAEIIDRILEQVGAVPAPAAAPAATRVVSSRAARSAPTLALDAPGEDVDVDVDVEADARDAEAEADAPDAGDRDGGDGDGGAGAKVAAEPMLGPDGEPLAEWEADLVRAGEPLPAARPSARPVPRPIRSGAPAGHAGTNGSATNGSGAPAQRPGNTTSAGHAAPGVAAPGQGAMSAEGADGGQSAIDDAEREGGRRRRRRNRNRRGGEDGPQGADRDDLAPYDTGAPAPVATAGETYGSNEPVEVAGYLDLRDEGYGFLRVGGYLPSRDDAYVSVKQTRQYGLRKGDHLTGTCRPAARNEKNPALLSITAVNGGDPEAARSRPQFDELTPVVPHAWLRLSAPGDSTDAVARIVDLVAPIGKGQRGLVLAPPRSGKSAVVTDIASAIERNHPEVELLVLLVDERPEEVTAMRRALACEVVASTFDRPNDEHVHVADLAIEKAKRLVESGADVVVIVDGLNRWVRAFHQSPMAAGRSTTGGIDVAALHAAKRLLAAARAAEEGGSLTLLATLAADTGSRLDDSIVEELAGTANLTLRLDRALADRHVRPPVDVAGSGTRHEASIVGEAELGARVASRQAAIETAARGTAASAVEALLAP